MCCMPEILDTHHGWWCLLSAKGCQVASLWIIVLSDLEGMGLLECQISSCGDWAGSLTYAFTCDHSHAKLVVGDHVHVRACRCHLRSQKANVCFESKTWRGICLAMTKVLALLLLKSQVHYMCVWGLCLSMLGRMQIAMPFFGEGYLERKGERCLKPPKQRLLPGHLPGSLPGGPHFDLKLRVHLDPLAWLPALLGFIGGHGANTGHAGWCWRSES